MKKASLLIFAILFALSAFAADSLAWRPNSSWNAKSSQSLVGVPRKQE